MSGTIYTVVANPPGDSNAELTEFMQENQLIVAEDHAVGLPVYINHNTPDKLGFPIEPSGITTNAHVAQDGRFLVSFKTLDNANGALADILLGKKGDIPPELQMKEVSLGYRMKKTADAGIPMFHRLEELSICYEGARDGTKIISELPVEAILEYEEKKTKESLDRFYKRLQDN
jgi:hypothetical protein